MVRHGSLTSLILLTTSLMAHAAPVVHNGDVTITSNTTWSDQHHQIHGNLYLNGGTLTCNSGTIELMCTTPRQYQVCFGGGNLSTYATTIGGTKDANNNIQQTVFNINDGNWYATDTTVRYSYGLICTGSSSSSYGYLQADNLIQGENPDTLIINGYGQAYIEDSTWDLAPTFNADVGQTVELDMPCNTSFSDVYGVSTQPGVNWHLNLVRHTANLWIPFFSGVANSGTITKYELDDCPNLVIGVLGTDVTGEASLPTSYSGDEPPYTWGYVPQYAKATIGKLEIEVQRANYTNLGFWALYLYGSSNVTIEDQTMLAELFVEDSSKLLIEGASDTYETWLAHTTTFVDTNAKLYARNVATGYFGDSSILPAVEVDGQAKFENVLLGDQALYANDRNIYLQDWEFETDRSVDEYEVSGYVFWHNSMVTGVSPSSTLRNNFTGYLGMQVTVDEGPLYMQMVGRYGCPDNAQTHYVYVYRVSDGAYMGYGTVNMSSPIFPWADDNGFYYGWCNSTLTLADNTDYYVVSYEQTNGDKWYDYDSSLSAGAAAYSTGAVWSSNLSTWNPSATDGQCYVPLNILWYDAP